MRGRRTLEEQMETTSGPMKWLVAVSLLAKTLGSLIALAVLLFVFGGIVYELIAR